jgi:tetratricopeptide (TPR) repeat protein
VIVEKGFILQPDEAGGGWAAHYLLLTGYDDGKGVFVTQDSFRTANALLPYEEMDALWRTFNRVYLLVYPADQEEQVEWLLGPHADVEFNREHALQTAQAEIEADIEDAFAWFNLGMNLVYFERYAEAAQAFDAALSIGLPARFMYYQFGPYIAYFNTGRYQDVIDLAKATLRRTQKAEESLLWRGWAYYQLGRIADAERDFRAALEVNPNSLDAQHAMQFLSGGG